MGVELAVAKTSETIAPRADESTRKRDRAGTSSGLNIAPGSDDDGWIIPHPVSLRDGTRVQLYKDGEALRAAYEKIRDAKRRICLEVYIFADDPTGQAFAQLLCEKAQQGVSVYVIYDSFGSLNTDREMFRKMRRAGVRIEEFHPIRPWDTRFGWRPVNRDHRKLIVVDDEFAWLGGLNIGNEYAGSWVVGSAGGDVNRNAWRDNAIGLSGAAARQFLHAFARTWRYVQAGGRIGKTEYIYGIDVNDPHVRSRARSFKRRRINVAAPAPDGLVGQPDLGILASAPTTSSVLRFLLNRLIAQATSSVRLTMAYFAPDDDLIDALCRAARRGAKVQLMLPAQCDVHLLLVAARSFYETLLKNGVEVFERQGCVLHAKTMVVDERVSIIGSTNLDYRSIEYNCELSAIIRNEQFGKNVSQLFENDMQYARRITAGEWRRRPWGDRFMQWAVSRARYIL